MLCKILEKAKTLEVKFQLMEFSETTNVETICHEYEQRSPNDTTIAMDALIQLGITLYFNNYKIWNHISVETKDPIPSCL